MKTTCATCRFGNFGPGSDYGECRRSAPRTTYGQIEPDVQRGYPETAVFPRVATYEMCGEHENGAADALTKIVRERIFGDGTADCEQRIIDLCIAAQKRFGIDRNG